MGGRRHRSDSSSSEQESRKRKHHKSDKKQSKKKHKRSSSKSESSKRSRAKRELDGDKGQPPSRISVEDDYFERNKEFRIWLKRSKRKTFQDLTSKEQRKYFKRFVSAWNHGELEDMYYAGEFPSELNDEARLHTSKHVWGFQNKLSERDRYEMDCLRDRIETDTTSSRTEKLFNLSRRNPRAGDQANVQGPPSAMLPPRSGGMLPPRVAGVGPSSRDGQGRLSKSAMKERLEELDPKETGRARMLQKRQEVANTIHAASRDADFNKDGMNLPESQVMGGNGDKEMQFLKQRRQLAEDRKRARTVEVLDREKQRMEQFKKELGFDPSKITMIKPRNDG